MRGRRLVLAAAMLAGLAALTPGAAAAAAPERLSATRTAYTFRSVPIRTGGFRVRFLERLAPKPRVGGFVVGMHARLVDERGSPVSIRDAMLHHAFFRRVRQRRAPLQCVGASGEAFYSTGEEDETLRLPRGYGYRLRRGDRWHLSAMIMSHGMTARRVFVEYRVVVDTDPRLTPVQPFWLRANGCDRISSYPVAGGGRAGARDVRTLRWRVPYAGRIVAASGHLHGGAYDMWLAQPRCGGRRLLDTRPRYGMPDDLMYQLRPVLHEPGPMDTRTFLSRSGIPVQRGETLAMTAAYDNHRPHWAVMATMHVYLARSASSQRACRPLPRDRRELTKAGPARLRPPVVDIPLSRLDAHGMPQTVTRPPVPARRVPSGTTVAVLTSGFSLPHVSLRAGDRLTWRFPEPVAHNVTPASAPRAVGALNYKHGETASARFAVPGRYTFFCSLHPMTMHAFVDVRSRAGR
jgi:plastocyanin